jgi:hypothetical protein
MNSRPASSSVRTNTPVKVDVLQLLFFLFGAPHSYGALKSDSNQNRGAALSGYSYLVLLAAAIAGGLEFLFLQG